MKYKRRSLPRKPDVRLKMEGLSKKQAKEKNLENLLWNNRVNQRLSWSCPECGNNLSEKIVELRAGFCNCEACGENFIKPKSGENNEDKSLGGWDSSWED